MSVEPRRLTTRRGYTRRQVRLDEIRDFLIRGRWIILGVFLAALIASWAYVQLAVPRYQAASLVLVKDASRTVPGTLSLEIGESQNLATEMLVLENSSGIAERVADRLFDLGAVPATGEPLSILVDQDGRSRSRPQVQSLLQRSYTSVEQAGRGLDALRLIGISSIPGEASLIANLFAEEYVIRTQDASKARATASRRFLETQEERLRSQLQEIEDQVTAYMSQTGAVALDQETARTVEQISQLEAMQDEATISIMMHEASITSLEAELQKIEPLLSQRIASEVDRDLTRVQEQLVDLEVQIDQIYSRYPQQRDNPSTNPALVELLARVESLKLRRDQLARDYVSEVLSAGGIDPLEEGGGLSQVTDFRRELAEERIALAGMRAKQRIAASRLSEYRANLKDIPFRSLELVQLERARQSTERLYLVLVENLQEAKLTEESEIGYAEILRPAGTPSTPVFPRKGRTVGLAGAFGLMAGIYLALLYMRLDNRIREPEVLENSGYSVLSVIPELTGTGGRALPAGATIEADGFTRSAALTMLLNPMAWQAEGYRRLRTSIQLSRPDQTVQMLLVTSPEPGEGKSLTSTNLAIAMAQAGRRTIIVDADLRRPVIHTLLGCRREPGLSELIFGSDPIPIKTLTTGIDNLFLISAGRNIPHPTEALGSAKARRLLGVLRENFDFIIVDTPPALAFSDAMLLATQCDASIIVAKAGSTRLPAFKEAVEMLSSVGSRPLGAVVNKVKPRRGPGYASAGGYKYYHYPSKRYDNYFREDT